jgi:predicted O-methyltransferase YrrM
MATAVDITRAKAITGWMHEEELHWLASKAAGCAVIVEVGSYKGRSTRALADHCPGVVHAVDPWANYVNDNGTESKQINPEAAWPQFQENMKDHLASGKLQVHRGTLATALGLRDLKADMVFIDGDHRYEAVMEDVRIARELLRKGGLLCGHDYRHKSWPGVKRAVNELFGEVPLCRTIWSVRV